MSPARRSSPTGFARTSAKTDSLHPARPVLPEPLRERRERPGIERLARLSHQVHVVVQVVDAREHRAEHFAATVEVVQVSAREVLAGVARTAHVGRRLIRFVARVAQLEVTEAREQVAVARIARRHHAIEHVDAGLHAFDQVFRRAHAHQVARLVRRQPVRRVRDDLLHQWLGLADADAADRITRKVERDQRIERRFAQVLEHAALHDAEQCVRVLQRRVFHQAALRPPQAQFHRDARLAFGRDVALGFIRRALVELHHDVAVEHALHLHADFRR